MTAYALLKLLHILSSTLLFGTGLGTAFFMWFTWRSGNLQAIATASRLTVLADWCFTTPAVLIQPLTGIALVRLMGFAWSSPWLQAAIALYLFTGACWLPVVVLQMRVRHMAVAALGAGQSLPGDCTRLMRWWFALGWPAFLAVMVIFWLMVAKPPLWS
ncbi:DUF2269 domain-containing protein [Dyella sp. RRB7]|uniref:DUF2269 family protein n=1 Tax=Dyella sp. RRB7 TaxID=2919502 RepID=UPI001FAA7396|nr:DUF2269 domain-containing protein [Dyella sp. RRB7]